MKKITSRVLSSIVFMSLLTGGAFVITHQDEVKKSDAAYSKTSLRKTNINLNDCTAEEIIAYYSDLNKLDDSERQGTNLLKNLKPILSNEQQYHKYDSDIWQMYEITDRDWIKSPAEDIPNFNSTTKIISSYTYLESCDESNPGPYVHALYNNRDVENNARAWYCHNDRGYAWTIEREHIWAKSHGFNDEKAAGAMGDPMHLQAGNGYVNGVHSNEIYGNVGKISTDCGTKFDNTKRNYKGISKTIGSGTVFEPQDEDKGDIARAVFYMVARYNNYAGKTASQETFDSGNPNLCLAETITDTAVTGESTATQAYSLGLIQDLLEWNRLDPVDTYEIHRNNLLYRNYTNNRNPFIDFPEWAEYIWGSNVDGKSYSSTPTGIADPTKDVINETFESVKLTLSTTKTNVDKGSYVNINATASDSKNYTVSWSSSDTNVATVSSSSSSTGTNIRINGKNAGSATITAQITVDNKVISATCSVKVVDQSIDSITIELDPTTLALDVGSTETITATVTATGSYTTNVTWSTADENVADVSESGIVMGVSEGTTTITCKSVSDQSVFATCDVTVNSVSTLLQAIYTPTSKTSISTSGSAPTGSSATYNNTYGQNQLTDGNSLTLTLSGYGGYRIEEIILSMKSNKTSGSGYLTLKTGSTTLANIGNGSGLSFSNANWNGAYSQSYVPINLKINKTIITNNQTIVLTINSTQNSLYFGSMTVNYSLPVSSVSLDQSSLELDINGEDTATLTETISPSDATNKYVEWTSSNDSVATVDDGYIEAVGVGVATITVTTEDGNKTATCTVTVIDSSSPVDPEPEDKGQSYYTLLDDVNDVTTGKYVIAVKVSSTYYSMSNTLSNGKFSKDATLSVNEYGVITNNSSDYDVFEFTVSSQTTTIKSENNYISYDASTSFKYSANPYTFNIITNDNGKVRLTCSTVSTRGIYYRTSTYNYFGAYMTSNISSSPNEYYDIELFKLITSYDLVSTFVNGNMKMTTIPTTDTSDTGACRGNNGYYITAKTAWNSLVSAHTAHTDLQTIFQTKFNDAYLRYLAWAEANHDANPFDGKNSISYKPSVISSIFNRDDNRTILIVVISSIISITGILSYLIFKKKKAN